MPLPLTVAEQLAKNTWKEHWSGCWLWTGTWDSNGYGLLTAQRDRSRLAHRNSYEYHVGPIPEGLQLDHLCRVHCCVNPAHLEPVTGKVNVQRGLVPTLSRARAALVTHCPKGHEYTKENTALRKARPGCRRCMTCDRARSLAHANLHRDERNAQRRNISREEKDLRNAKQRLDKCKLRLERGLPIRSLRRPVLTVVPPP